ncbi:hypothetical protein GCK72_015814 [Caenorhabditis remanei]|uniref:Uncharacterized protein n=1 Tax=Caenorhabditis remanei TaxID=31234 RepID=A0A6A5GXK5_CAERE|nr:hypothetical protein GCK72_015814 [Caenorhabditis remanei]KAF1759349.1 hypothetical protein GCK72_015814 [Caenorhabditis remanei]
MTDTTVRTRLPDTFIGFELTFRAGEHFWTSALISCPHLLTLSTVIAWLSGTHILQHLTTIADVSWFAMALSTMHEDGALGVVLAHFGGTVDWETRGFEGLPGALSGGGVGTFETRLLSDGRLVEVDGTWTTRFQARVTVATCFTSLTAFCSTGSA